MSSSNSPVKATDLLELFSELMKSVNVGPGPVAPVSSIPAPSIPAPSIPTPSTLPNTKSEPKADATVKTEYESVSFSKAVVDATGKALAELLIKKNFTNGVGAGAFLYPFILSNLKSTTDNDINNSVNSMLKVKATDKSVKSNLSDDTLISANNLK